MQAFFALIDVDADNSSLTVDSTPTNSSVGEYYIYSPTVLECYLDDLCATISTAHGATVGYTITAGVVTLSAAANFTIADWDLGEVLGFTTDLSGDNSYTATNHIKYCWFPSTDAANSLATLDRQGTSSAIISQATAPDGSTFTSKWGTLITQELTYQFLPPADTWDDGGNEQSFEEFWNNTYSEGRSFLFMPYYGAETDAHKYVADLSNDVGMLVERQIAGCNAYWKITLKLKGI